MNKHPHRRRILSAILIVFGGVLIFLAPDNAWIGAVLAISGIVIELIAFGLARRGDDRQ
jgi:drug/metabolite transporter (DMT)-like permease